MTTYFLSAYTLVVLCIRTPYMYRRSKMLIKGDELRFVVSMRKFLNKFTFTRRYLSDIEFRATTSLVIGFGINSIYAGIGCIYGVVYQSVWFISIGIYYFVFGSIRFMLLKKMKTSILYNDEITRNRFELKTYRTCGILLFSLNVTMAGMIIQMIWENKIIHNYSELLVYFSALFTFYSVILSITNLVKFRKNKNIILSASKNLTFVGALMSIFILQTTMLLAFDNGEVNIQKMNFITGVVIIMLSLGIAIFMILKARYKMNQL